MKPYPALATLEFDDIPSAIHATDAMLKKASIAFFKSGTITHGRYLTLIGGTTGSVEESAHEGSRCAEGHLLDMAVLPDVHAALYEAVLGQRRATGGALAVVETGTVSASVRAAEAALKGTRVNLLEIRLADRGLSGHALTILEGHLHDIEAAVGLAIAAAQSSGQTVSWRVIPAPHDAVVRQLANGSWFGSALLVELEGESL